MVETAASALVGRRQRCTAAFAGYGGARSAVCRYCEVNEPRNRAVRAAVSPETRHGRSRRAARNISAAGALCGLRPSTVLSWNCLVFFRTVVHLFRMTPATTFAAGMLVMLVLPLLLAMCVARFVCMRQRTSRPRPSDEVGLVEADADADEEDGRRSPCLLYTSPSPRDGLLSRMPSSA